MFPAARSWIAGQARNDKIDKLLLYYKPFS